MSELQLGDVVQLKSGGPLMTVSGFSQDSHRANGRNVRCVWFRAGESKAEEIFADVLLEKMNA